MTLRPISNLGTRELTYIDYPECQKCGDRLGMGPDWKEIDGKKYCNSCAIEITKIDL